MVADSDAEYVRRLERVYAAGPIRAQRSRTLAVVAATAGERGLDIGCGPGLLTCELARAVGAGGHVVALDASAPMLAAARARATKEGVWSQTHAAVADASSLPFGSGSFDFVVAVQVYLYVAEVDAALDEAARVLRPGGRLVVVDTDWDSCVWLTSRRESGRRILEARVGYFAQPHLPPLLPGMIAGAGLRLERVEAIPLIELAYEPDSFSADMLAACADYGRRAGIAAEEVEAWQADLLGRTGLGQYFFSVNRYLFAARKPA